MSLGRKEGVLAWSAPSLPAAEEQLDQAVKGALSPGAQGSLQREWRLGLDRASRGGVCSVHTEYPQAVENYSNAFPLPQTQLIKSLGHFPLPKQCAGAFILTRMQASRVGMSSFCPVIPVSEAPPRQSGDRSPHGATERRARVQREHAQWQESEQRQTTTWAMRTNEDPCAPPSRGSWMTRYFVSCAQQTGDEVEGNLSFTFSQAQC